MSPSRTPTAAVTPVLSICLLLLASGPALGHEGGDPSIARPLTPSGLVTVDGSLLIEWADSEDSHVLIPATIDLYYTDTPPATFEDGHWPEDLTGTAIAVGIPQSDPANALIWDTSAVPDGTYSVYAITTDPPFTWVAFSPGVVTVSHGAGGLAAPAVVVTKPDSLNDTADGSFVIQYAASDPDGTATVRLDAVRGPALTEVWPIASDLAATANGALLWDTSQLPVGAWTVRATIIDGRGLSSTSWAPAFLTVRALAPVEIPADELLGACSATGRSGAAPVWIGGLVLLLLVGLRRGIPRSLVAGLLVAASLGGCHQSADTELALAQSGLSTAVPLPEDLLRIHDGMEDGRLDAFFPSYYFCKKAKSCGSFSIEEGIGALRGDIQMVTHPHPGRVTAASWSDYDLIVQLKSDVQHPDAVDELGFRRRRLNLGDVHSTYGYVLRHQNGTWTLIEHGSGFVGANEALATVDHPKKETKAELIALEDWMMEWHEVVVSVTTPAPGAAHIRVFVDGAPIMDVFDETAQAQGYVELRHLGPPASSLWVDHVEVLAHADTRSTWTRTGSIDGGWLSAIAVDPRDSAVAYAAAWDGGLYKTVNGGAHWEEIGVPHGLPKVRIRTIVLAPSNPDIVYVGTAMKHVSSLWRSGDGGMTWSWTSAGDIRLRKTLDTSVGYREGDTYAIAVDPTDPMHLFVGIDTDGVYESHDGGQTFELEPDCDPSTLSPAKNPACDYVPPHRATAAGKKKTGVSVGVPGAIAIDPENSQFVVAGTRSGSASAIVRSIDGGDTWVPWNVVKGGKPVLGRVTHLLFSDTVGGTRRLFAVLNGTLYRSSETTDGTGQWTAWLPVLVACAAEPGMDSPPPKALSVVATIAALGVTGALMVFRGKTACTPHNILKSPDLGDSWLPVHQTTSPVGDFLLSAAAVGQEDPGVVYALSYARGVVVADDFVHGGPTAPGALSFEGRNTGLSGHRTLALATVPGAPERVLMGDVLGLWQSSDYGDTWTRSLHRDKYMQSVLAVTVHPGAPDVVWAAGQGGWAPNPKPILRSTAFGAAGTFKDPRCPVDQPCPKEIDEEPFPFGSVTALAVDPANPAVLYAGTGLGPYKGWAGSGLWRSLDFGASWHRLAAPDDAGCDPIGDVSVPAIVVDPTSFDPELGRCTRIAVATSNAQGVYTSVDGGACFVARPNGTEQTCAAKKKSIVLDSATKQPLSACPLSMIWSLVADPSQPEVLYAATNTLFGFGTAFDPGGNRVYRSPDFGETWELFAVTGMSVDAMAIDPRRPEDVYFAMHDAGIARADANSGQWSYVNDGLIPLLAHIYPMRLAVSEGGRGEVVLYSGSCGRGVFRNHLHQAERPVVTGP